MESLNKTIDKVMMVIFGLIGTAMILVASYNVVARDFLRISAPWTDEALKLLDIWMIFVMSAVVFLQDGQISLTLIEDGRGVRSKPAVYHSMKLFQYVLAGVLNFELCKELISIVKTQVSTNEVTTVLQYPLYFLNVGMLIGSALTVIFAVIKVVDQVKNFNVSPGFIE